ncbi:MAG: SIMPL domain-containing protein [Acidobacteriia bacterium]|nr:SIMPL domain-containing protein [Terriglobia bacterium]
MKRLFFSLGFLLLFSLCFLSLTAGAQSPDVKFIADTLVVQAEGTYEADPDLATLSFDISAQEKELKLAYDKATQSMRKIVDLAERNGLKKDEIALGVLTVQPFYEGDRKKRARSYQVSGHLVLKVKDFSRLGTLMDESIQDGIADFRSLTYSLADEEAAKQKAVAEAMKRAIGRAGAALEQKGQKVGSLRFANLDVKQLVGVSRMDAYSVAGLSSMQAVEVTADSGMFSKNQRAAAPPPVPQPEKITVSATVQCAFQIQ